MGGLGFPELIIIFLVLLLVFGAKRIPEIARGIGKGIREFKSATNEISQEIEAEGQDRQINQPQSPQQGTPQSRQGQQQNQPQSAPQQPASASSDNAAGTEPESESASTEASPSGPNQKETTS
jgi:sec-independent protein translocase protein TatA